MTGEEKLGLLANLERCKAQQIIHLGKYDHENYQAVYDLYLKAYGNKELALRAKSAAAERFANAAMRAARES
jgi:hypothetical protein